MAIPTITMSCNSLPLTAIETAANNCELDTTTKKFGSGSIKILQGGYIDVAMPSVFNILTDSWTVEHWFSITDLETDNYHHLINADNNANGQWAVYVDNTGKLTLNRRGGTAITSTVAIANNEWHHLRVTHTGNKTLKAYLDGNLFATNTFSAAPDSMRIGKPLGESTRWYTGNIDEIAFTILDASNVAEYSGDTAPVPTEGYPDEVRSPGVVINGLFLSTSKPTAGDKGLLINNKFFIPFAESSEGGSGTDTSDATAGAGDILNGKTAYVNGEKITGTISSYTGSSLIIPGVEDKVLSTAEGIYLPKVVKVAGDSNLLAGNIKSGVSIFGIVGTLESGGGDTSAFESDAMAIIGTPTGGGSGGESGDEIITLVSESGSQGQSKVAINATNSVIVTNGSASQTYTEFPAEFTLSAGTTTIQGTVTTLDCTTSTLTSIDISLCPTLTSLDCKGNALLDLDISNNANLVTLACNNNGLTMLNIAQNTVLKSLAAYSNKFTSDVVNNVLASLVLNAKTNGTLDINYQEISAPPTGQGLADKQTLIDRGWTVTTD